MNNIKFEKNSPEEMVLSKKDAILHFHNLNNLYWLVKNDEFRVLSLSKNNYNYPDGKILSIRLGLRQQRGPDFTKSLLVSDFAKKKKHSFINMSNADVDKIAEISGIDKRKMSFIKLPFISGIEFSKKDKDRMVKELKNFKPDIVWMAVGSPKQDILSIQLQQEYKAVYLNVGAAFDFILRKKNESPKIFTKMGLEWFYRLLTDFKYSKIKVWRSFLGLFYLGIAKK